jgi:hypothetical protein
MWVWRSSQCRRAATVAAELLKYLEKAAFGRLYSFAASSESTSAAKASTSAAATDFPASGTARPRPKVSA